MSVHPRLLLLSAALVCLPSPVAALPADPPPARDPKELAKIPPYKRMLQGEDVKRVAELEAKLARAESAGKFAEAEEVARQILAIRMRAQGKDHWQIVDAEWDVKTFTKLKSLPAEKRKELTALGKLVQDAHQRIRKGMYAEAERLLWKALEIRRLLLGEEHPDTVTGYNNVAYTLDAQGKYAQAETLNRKALEIRRRVLGEEHPKTAGSYNNLATNLDAQGKYTEAESPFRAALAIWRRVLGEENPNTAVGYNNVAANLAEQGNYTEAERLHRKALAIRRRVLGDEHVDTAASYNNVAANLHNEGKLAEAEPFTRKSLAILQRVMGEDHPDTAVNYNNVAANMDDQGKHAEAEPLLRKALAIRLRVLGEEHPATAGSYNNVAANLDDQGKHAEAEPLHRKALAIRIRVLREEHPDTTASYNNLAANLAAQGKYAEAEPLNRKALAIRLRVLREEHPDIARSYNNMAANLSAQGKYAEAEPFFRKSLAIWHRVLGEEHPDTVRNYNNLAFNLSFQGRYAEAEEIWTIAAASFERMRQAVGFAGLERTSHSAKHSPLSGLAGVLARNGKPAEAWRRLEENLGRALYDDLSACQARRLSPEERKRQQELITKLERLDKLFAHLPPAKENSPERQKQLDDLKKQYGAAQAAYSGFEAEMARKYGAAAGDVYSIAKIQDRLPADTALLAWLDIQGQPKAADPNGEHWAFVLRHRGDPVCVKLPGSGPKGAWTKDDDELPGRAAKFSSQRPREADADSQKLVALLAKQRLAPITKILAGDDKLPPVKHVIVLPSASMADVPVETLLTEKNDITVSYAPSGTIYTWLREKKPLTPTPLPSGERGGIGLLALADPAFAPLVAKKEATAPDHGVFIRGVVSGQPAENAGLRSGDVLLTYGETKLSKLADLGAAIKKEAAAKVVALAVWRDGKMVDLKLPPGSMGVQVDQRPAAEAIRGEREFTKLMQATRGPAFQPLPGSRREVEAISQAIRSKDKEARITVLEGSDASEQQLDALIAKNELAKYRYVHLATHGVADRRFHLKSYLVLAQDKLPDPVEQVLAGKPAYDGKLTAEQIMRTWNLNADLVVLSACESALGKFGGGEGYLGFSQALLLAGARSVVLSLWKVDDDATALLMTRFYQNLLKPMPKAEALSEAKKWLRSLTAKEVTDRLNELPRGTPREKRAAPPSASPRPFEHPYYWAAFILIGDPD